MIGAPSLQRAAGPPVADQVGQRVPRGDLDSRASEPDAAGQLLGVDLLPVGERGRRPAPLGEQHGGVRTRGRGQAALGQVGEQQPDGGGGVRLVRADHPQRTPLDPADDVLAGPRAGGVHHAAPSLGITPLSGSNGTPGSGLPR